MFCFFARTLDAFVHFHFACVGFLLTLSYFVEGAYFFSNAMASSATPWCQTLINVDLMVTGPSQNATADVDLLTTQLFTYLSVSFAILAQIFLFQKKDI
jgi:hypothetical protein